MSLSVYYFEALFMLMMISENGQKKTKNIIMHLFNYMLILIQTG